MPEYVDALTAGGVVTIDVTASIENGQLDDNDCEGSGEILAAVRKAVDNGNALDDENHRRVLFTSRPLALTYYVKGGK